MSQWTPNANAQALAVSAAIEAARKDGRRQERERIRRAPLEARCLDDLARLLVPIPPDSPADPEKTWSHRDSGE